MFALGSLMLELGVGPKASRVSLSRMRLKYSRKLFEAVSALLDDNPSCRARAF